MSAREAAAAPLDYEPVAEIKHGQVGIASIKLKKLDADALEAELRAKVDGAEKLFRHAPVVLDLSHLPQLPDVAVVRDLLARIHAAGMLPVGLSYGSSENERIARELDVPVIAKFRASYERAQGDAALEPAPQRATPAPPSRETVVVERVETVALLWAVLGQQVVEVRLGPVRVLLVNRLVHVDPIAPVGRIPQVVEVARGPLLRHLLMLALLPAQTRAHRRQISTRRNSVPTIGSHDRVWSAYR